MPVYQNTYRKLDRDTAYNKTDNSSFYDCRNFRITSNDPLKNGALSSVKGNKPLVGDFSTLGYATDKIIGSVQLRDNMILFTTNDDTATPTASYGRIWRAPFYNDAIVMSSIVLLYSGQLNFSQQHPIEDAVAFYESDTIQKVYWTDHYNDLRFCNIADTTLSTKDPDEFNIVQQFYSVTPQFSKMISGSIPVGMVQYAFRLYKLNGPVSNFSNASQLIPLAEYTLSATNTYKFKGSDRLDAQGNPLSSGKGITMTIDLSTVDNSNYDRIEVVAIHYAALNEVPTINIVEVKPLSSIITFTDEGIYNLGSYSLSEFSVVNNPFKCKTIATKNNILFAGNIEQIEFDVEFDARAYRWTQSRQCRLDEANGEYWVNQMGTNPTFIHYNSSGVSIGSVASMSLLPDDIDAICRTNDLSIDSSKTQTSYIYKSDGTTVGGEGINVSYTFSVANRWEIDNNSSVIDDIGVNATASPWYYNGPASPYLNQRIRTWQRDEIYRYGAILIDNKGRHSPVKWIADIRIPNNSMTVSTFVGFAGKSYTTTYSHPIQVDFQIDNLPTEVVAVKIVYVKRTDKDRTVKLQGMAHYINVGPGLTYNNVSTLQNSTVAGFNSAAAKHIAIFSPEISFYKNFSQGVNDYVEVVGTYSGTISGSGFERTSVSSLKAIDFVSAGVGRFSNVVTSRIQNVTDAPDEEPNFETFGLITNFKAEIGNINGFGNASRGNLGTSLLVQLNSVLPLSTLTATSYLLVNYRSNLFGSQYGGYTYEDRTRNEYISASDQINVTAGSATIPAIYGDTYIQYADHLESFYNDYYATVNTVNWTLMSNIMFPVETTVNLAYRLDDSWHTIHSTFPSAYFLREIGNAEFTVPAEGGVTYSNGWADLYLENTAYKRLSDAKKYYPAPIDYDPEFKNDALVMASNMKEGLETFDPWTQWVSNESINVDKKYGPVNKLVSWKNYLLYWQDDAIGALSVLDRSVVSDAQGRSTTLGQGEVLQRYDNIATNIGLSTRFSIANSINGIYWYDNKRRKISRFLNNIEDMSTIRGVNSYLNDITSDLGEYDNIISANSYMKGFFMSYNPMYNEIWFTIKQSYDNGLALVYNEVVDGFTGFVDTMAYHYMVFNNKVFSAYDKYLYKEDKGYPGLFFGKYYDSYVSVVVTPIPNIVTTLTNLEISSEVYETVLDPEVAAIDVPALTTTAVTSVSGTGAMSGGNITNIGGVPVFERGVVYGPSALPLVENDSRSIDGTGPGAFTSTIRGLIPSTLYYLRAYATNSVGTGYGAVRSFITVIPPIVDTVVISNITETTADSGWILIEDGGEEPIECGICWSTSINPTTADTKNTLQSVVGTYYSTITGLVDSTVYHVRAYAINSKGTVYGPQKSFNTTYLYAPTLSTYAASSISTISADSGGYDITDGGTPITERGICYSTSPTPTIASSKVVDSLTGTDAFVSSLSSLTDDTYYYVRAYATNKKGTSYGNQVTFTTLDLTIPSLLTMNIELITETTAWSGGIVLSDGNAPVTERGICYSTSPNPTTANTKVVDIYTGTGSYSAPLAGLTGGTTYYVRAYAINSQGTAYGDSKTLTTIYIGIPTVITTDPTLITYNGATSGGNVISENNATVTEKGIRVGTSTNPLLNAKFAHTTAGIGSWVKLLNTLDDATTFYINAYAINSRGTGWGNQVSFTTLDALPGVVSTTSISLITYNSARSGGNVTSDGGSPILAKGVCWSTSINPTISDSKTTDGTGLGSYVSDLTSLTAGTTYYVRAYATNTEGTSYGANISFTAIVRTAPVVSINSVGIISETSAAVSASVLNNGGDTVTEYGFCWGTSVDPTVAGSHINSYPGAFSYTIPGLTDATVYFVRAYAINSIGTTYSSNLSFTTTSYLVASVQTMATTGLWQTYLTANGNVSSDGGAYVTERGFYFGTDPVPTLNTKYAVGMGLGLYSKYFDSLTQGTNYYITAYAINSKGTTYGARIMSTTVPLTVPVVQTVDVSTVRTITARAYGNVTSDGGASVTGRGFTCSTSPGSTTPYASSGSGTGSFNAGISSLTAGTTYYLRAYATNSQGTAYGEEVSFTTLLAIGANHIMDIDGNIYNVITIGSQQWMVENLRVTHYADGTEIPFITDNTTARDDTTGYLTYYNNDIGYKIPYGCLYSGYAIVNPRNLVSIFRDDVPLTGWRVPTPLDAIALYAAIGGSSLGGGLLKEAGTTHWLTPNTRANNAYGWTSLPGGWRSPDHNMFGQMGEVGDYWLTAQFGNPTFTANEYFFRHLYNSAEMLTGISINTPRNCGFSVRLMRDV